MNQVLVIQEKEDKIPTDADKNRVNMFAESFLNFYGDATEAAEAYMGFQYFYSSCQFIRLPKLFPQ